MDLSIRANGVRLDVSQVVTVPVGAPHQYAGGDVLLYSDVDASEYLPQWGDALGVPLEAIAAQKALDLLTAPNQEIKIYYATPN